MKKLIVLFAFILTIPLMLRSQSTVIESKGTISLSVGEGPPYGLGGKNSISVNDLIYSNDLSFIGRQTSDNSYLYIDVNAMTFKNVAIESAFFLFRGSSNPVQFVYAGGYGDRVNTSPYDSVVYYNFQTQQVAGAIAYEREAKVNGTWLGDHSGVIDLDGENNTLLLHWLKVGETDEYVGVKMIPPSNAGQKVLSFEEYKPSSWQTVDYANLQAPLKISFSSSDKYTSPASTQMDSNKEYLRLKCSKTIHWNLKKMENVFIDSDAMKTGSLLPGGIVATLSKVPSVEKGSTKYTTVVKLYDIKFGTEVKTIPLGDRNYEVFFSNGKYALYYDTNPDAQKFTPYLLNLETGESTEIPFKSPIESLFTGKKKFKGNITQLRVAGKIIYNIEQVLFSSDMKRMVIASNLDLGSADQTVAYTVNGKRVYREELLDVYELK